jgi:hypothetical protein
MGVSTVIIGEHEWLGGCLQAQGSVQLTATIICRGYLGRIQAALEARYGGDSLLRTGWSAISCLNPLLAIKSSQQWQRPSRPGSGRHATVTRVKRIRDKWRITVSREDRQVRYYAKILIDATELGDIAAMCGVEYDLGMDSKHDTGEEIAPEKGNDIIQDLTYVAILKITALKCRWKDLKVMTVHFFLCLHQPPLCRDRICRRWICRR